MMQQKGGKGKIARNAAKIEFLANVEDVFSMISRGYNLKNVHSELTEKGRFTMSYYTFCWHLRIHSKQKTSKKTILNVAPPIQPPTQQKNEGFGQIENVDLSKLF